MNRTQSSDQTSLGISDTDRASSDSSSETLPRISILHIYAGNLYGGIETMLATLARTSPLEPSMQMEYALCFPGRLRDELKTAGAIVHDLGPVKFRHPWTIARSRRRLANLLKQRRFDVVVTHACWPHALFASTVRRARRAVVFWQHDFVGTGHWIERLAARTRPDLVISNSKASAATLPQLFPDVPFDILCYPVLAPTPLPNPIFARRETRRELGITDDSVVIVQVCRMERWKGHTLLLEALGRLHDRHDWVAWIVGGAQRPHERTYLAELKAKAAALGIGDRVRFLGQRDDVPRLLGAADIHCQPNTGPEPFGIAFIEALLAGLPVVTTRMGGAIEILIPDCGILIEPGDVAGLADALRRLVTDPAERVGLGVAGSGRAASLCEPRYTLRQLSGFLFNTLDRSS